MEEKEAKIIAVSGCAGIGKSTFSIFFVKSVNNDNKKILLIDFDIEENHIKTILKIKKKNKDLKNIDDYIININKNLDILCDLNIFFNYDKQNSFIEIRELIENFKKKYDLIVIDTSINIEKDYIRMVLYNCNKILFLIEPNILGVKKAKTLLEIFENDWKIDINKIKIIINKANIYQLSDCILSELFEGVEIIGKIKYNDFYNLMINKNICKNEIKKEYQNLQKVI